MLTQPEYRMFKAGLVIAKAVGNFARKMRRQKLLQRSALKIQTLWRSKSTKQKAYIEWLNILKDKRIYFLKEQRLDFQKILRSTLETFKVLKKDYSLEQLRAMVTVSNDYQMVRYPNPLVFKR